MPSSTMCVDRTTSCKYLMWQQLKPKYKIKSRIRQRTIKREENGRGRQSQENGRKKSSTFR